MTLLQSFKTLLHKLLTLLQKKQTVKIKIQKLHPNAKIPEYAHIGDSGFDLSAVETVILPPRSTMLISTGIAFGIPNGLELQIRPRSGISLKTNLRISNSPGTVDASFNGEIKIICSNIGDIPIEINQGMRIAQGAVCPVIHVDFEETEVLNSTERGTNGFGSSGTN